MAGGKVMTEKDWLTTADPTPMLDYLRLQNVSERKMRLLACACCRLIWDYLPDARSRRAILVAERFADDRATPKELGQVRGNALSATDGAVWAAYWAANVKAAGILSNVFAAAAAAPARRATQKTKLVETWVAVQAESLREQAALIREVVGNPFREPWLDPRWLSWEGGQAVRLAEGVYEESAFDRLPFLGDALEEAGCDSDEVLAHCRHGGPHARGCWVVDLVLGKA